MTAFLVLQQGVVRNHGYAARDCACDVFAYRQSEGLRHTGSVDDKCAGAEVDSE